VQSAVFTEWVKAFEKKNKQEGREGQILIIGYNRNWSFDDDDLLNEVKEFIECLENNPLKNKFRSIYFARLYSNCLREKLLKI
jgi:hypothetical protein